ncbi:MAG: phytanoyl-CoA dioxygenase [Okeania sp. SIO3I5]|uniref:phytanoyl-CoA dioxygenase family protein n=1 Tax=Okeania sp. SIO3I5 TaxID=2607805 RepID=UPI0013B7AD21|nr:phytanoyl-CoA dioxygenase family protein [Okeania sp. SIO3I5]NEQ39037.1 phytanoyl-CoA dioxygenase [Okeania sp. SIO3I5]
MQLSSEQLQHYQDRGYLFLPNVFDRAEVEVMKAELPAVYGENSLGKIVEEDGKTVRIVHGSHTKSDVFKRLSQHPRIIDPVMQILESAVYIHQFKISAKVAFEGDIWQWHQDYVYYKEEDGIPEPRIVNTAIFLDEVNEFNAPLMLVPGSQKEGLISVFTEEEQHNQYQDGPSWISRLTSKLHYIINKETLEKLVKQYGIVAPKGAAGSVLLFHPSCVHGSGANMSPFDRALVIINYNSVENTPKIPIKEQRPEFLASLNYTPIEPLSDEVLLV